MASLNRNHPDADFLEMLDWIEAESMALAAYFVLRAHAGDQGETLIVSDQEKEAALAEAQVVIANFATCRRTEYLH